MTKVVISILDKGAGFFSPPTYMRSIGEATRSFIDHVADESGVINKHPEQFVLYKLGEFDDNTGEFVELEPEPLMKAVDCLDVGRASSSEQVADKETA